jgi:hypothetical protein
LSLFCWALDWWLLCETWLCIGLSGFANMPPIALGYIAIIVLKYPNSLWTTKFLSK